MSEETLLFLAAMGALYEANTCEKIGLMGDKMHYTDLLLKIAKADTVEELLNKPDSPH